MTPASQRSGQETLPATRGECEAYLRGRLDRTRAIVAWLRAPQGMGGDSIRRMGVASEIEAKFCHGTGHVAPAVEALREIATVGVDLPEQRQSVGTGHERVIPESSYANVDGATERPQHVCHTERVIPATDAIDFRSVCVTIDYTHGAEYPWGLMACAGGAPVAVNKYLTRAEAIKCALAGLAFAGIVVDEQTGEDKP